MPPPVERKLAAMLSADVMGYSRLMAGAASGETTAPNGAQDSTMTERFVLPLAA